MGGNSIWWAKTSDGVWVSKFNGKRAVVWFDGHGQKKWKWEINQGEEKGRTRHCLEALRAAEEVLSG